MPPKLFEDALDLRDRLLSFYATELLEQPPVTSVSPAGEPDAGRRAKNAKVFALKDVARVARAFNASGLTIDEWQAICDLYKKENRNAR